MEEKKKPGRPLSVIYADAKQAITRQVGNTMAAYGLPIFMAQGMLRGVLAEIRSNAANELADDTARYEEELKEYYETEAKEKQETFEKEKEELITLFENPEEVLHRKRMLPERSLLSRRWSKWQIFPRK